ncbi:MAG TPA: ATP-binding protein [Flavobacteriaceae bacterium]|nr:ATP-binding protein [Flavobacteriaceae bacterium]HQU21533.1 ATP-binding protein [Flavobacteriaceae bacterium]HQU65502.1 ATP-binding protein [Flavobacteriaceae bacterium]HRW45659.1 ATP-binding protein [Flavobacteriaceae bacterium]
MNTMTNNTDLSKVFSFLREIIAWRMQNPEGNFDSEAPKCELENLGNSLLPSFAKEQQLSQKECVILFLAMAPHILPDFLITTVSDVFPNGTDFPIFGGTKGKHHRGILPTGETVQFLLAGNNLNERIACNFYFEEDHLFYTKELLYLDSVPEGEPLMSGKLLLFQEAVHLLTTGKVPPPKLSTDFPAERLDTSLTWDDLVLNPKTEKFIKELEIWLLHNKEFMEEWGMKNRVKAGYRALFYGPPGTGKTLTASLLGKYTQKPVYRIDLSTVVSKYIGETEKHLSNLFNRAANKDWILFFDEADAIFGKRTNVRDAHDKYANQEVSYLLQRVETHPGLVILASNVKDNIDEAFTRRFQSFCPFELPGERERKLLWQINLPKKLLIAQEIDWNLIAKKYYLSGSNIVNIIQYCSLQVLYHKQSELTLEILMRGIKREYHKEDRLF